MGHVTDMGGGGGVSETCRLDKLDAIMRWPGFTVYKNSFGTPQHGSNREVT